MTLFLTGSPTRYGEPYFTQDNGFRAEVVAALRAVTGEGRKPRVLLVSAAPDDRGFTASVQEGMSLCIHRSGIATAFITMLDRHNAHRAAELVHRADWVILCGGHAPTQNRFLHEIGLAALLRDFPGVIMGCSAGSMNCAGKVYSHPEFADEAIDPHYCRWLEGLGLTDINLIPHLHQVRDMEMYGRRLFEDIIFPDGGFVKVQDGRSEFRGEAYEIYRGTMRRICEENQSYPFMNLVFISPHFPNTYWQFCAAARRNGVNVLGIADTNFENLPWELQQCLTDYYKVNSLENYDEVYNGVAFFAHKYGKVDWIESNNEYWLEQDARLRTAFGVTTGIGIDRVSSIRNKSEMKKYYALGGVPTARQIRCAEGLEAVKAFTALTGYPVVAKPDSGMGASGTDKLKSDAEVEAWFAAHPNYGYYVIEEFITGELLSYDAIFNSKLEPIFENNSMFPVQVMDIIHDNLDCCYWTNKTVPPKLAEIGRRTVRAFNTPSRFVHLEFFQLDRDREGLGKKGDYVGLEVNMRPPGGYTPDMMNYAHSTDVFQIWADMVAFDERRKGEGEQYYCAYAARRDSKRYAYSEQEIWDRYGTAICFRGRVPDALSDDLGNECFIVRFKNKKDINPFLKFVTKPFNG